ncbi:hypothetical protein PSTG_07988 [Puccinia striiformis f. sp. tritici PST-78]|uniref:Uncharacterized protein n=1 Tax=Puccinia striiformis f. sp. tritici PST-78 TaxID=1165861 RepID=A0A0L0VHP1_9BASI|nr:hypothetical protein PSTG_07988 [Puccinia striiformis f. sp. tritici PST-78]
MLPKNLLSSILHALAIIHTTLAMKIPYQPMEVCEDIKSMENTHVAGTLDLRNDFQGEQCRWIKETTKPIEKDMKVIREHIEFLKGANEPIYMEVASQLEEIDSHVVNHIQAKIIHLGREHREVEQNSLFDVMGKRKANPLGVQNTQSHLQEGEYHSMDIDTLGNEFQGAKRVKHTEGLISRPEDDEMPDISQAAEGSNTDQLFHIWNNLQTKINNWRTLPTEYDDIKKMFISVKCLFLFGNLIKKHHLIEPSLMGRINTFEPETVFKMATLDLNLKSKTPGGLLFDLKFLGKALSLWQKTPVAPYLQPFTEALPEYQQKSITFLYLKDYLSTAKALFETGLESFEFILEGSPPTNLLARLDDLSSKIGLGISTIQGHGELDLVNKIKNCFKVFDNNHTLNEGSSVVGQFTINYHFIKFIKTFYKQIFDKLKPVNHEGNSLGFEAKIKLVEDFLIYAQDQVGDLNLKNLKEHYEYLLKENKPGSFTYFDWSTPLMLSLLKQRRLHLLMTQNLS